MPRYYTYLESSLPLLHFGVKPPMNYGRFLEMCQGLIGEEEIEILKGLSLSREGASSYPQPTLNKWTAFDTALRNELVKIRAQRKHIDPVKHLRPDGYLDSSIARIAMGAFRNPSILESEEALDLARWQKLDELSAGHFFDFDTLILYAYKLLLLDKWERIRSADTSKILKESLKR